MSGTYDEELARGLDLTGEDRLFYARGRIAWLARQAAQFGVRSRRVLDYGCGIGDTAPLLLEGLGAASVLGVDPSSEFLDAARRQYGSASVAFQELDKFARGATSTWLTATAYATTFRRRSARPWRARSSGPFARGGLFALWENNPWNIGTRIIMSRVSFDRDAVLLWPGQARRLLRENGFEVLGTTYRFVFPSFLKALRPLEDRLAGIGLGGQYQVLARRPE